MLCETLDPKGKVVKVAKCAADETCADVEFDKVNRYCKPNNLVSCEICRLKLVLVRTKYALC